DANIVSAPEDCCSTALHHAARNGHLRCLKVLIDAGARVDIRNKEGKTAMQIAFEKEEYDCGKYLRTVEEYVMGMCMVWGLFGAGSLQNWTRLKLGALKRLDAQKLDDTKRDAQNWTGKKDKLGRQKLDGHLNWTHKSGAVQKLDARLKNRTHTWSCYALHYSPCYARRFTPPHVTGFRMLP
ncbi:hypothetical protein OS493_040524, partial [Desmophyllum pertusum]